MSEPSTPPSSPRGQQPNELKGSIILGTPKKVRQSNPYDCKEEFPKGLQYFLIHALCLVAINSGISAGVNYFKGREVIPIKGAILSSLAQTSIHYLMVDGLSWGMGCTIRKLGSGMVSPEEWRAVILGGLLTPILTYYGTRTLFHHKITVLPTILFSGIGAIALTGFELSRKS